MGRGRHKGRSQRKNFKESIENVWKCPKSDTAVDASDNAAPEIPNWEPILTDSPSFEDYCKEQGIVKAEEWDLFMEILCKPLPVAFRFDAEQSHGANAGIQVSLRFSEPKGCEHLRQVFTK